MDRETNVHTDQTHHAHRLCREMRNETNNENDEMANTQRNIKINWNM